MQKIINYIKNNLGYLFVILGICTICFFSFVPQNLRPRSFGYYSSGELSRLKYEKQVEIAIYKTIGVFCTVIGSFILIKKFKKIV